LATRLFDLQSGEIVGGYLLGHSALCLGTARLKTGCIGAVAVDKDQRKRGVASALMEDAIACVQSQQLALLFLTGIPNFYHRFGYAPVIENTDVHLERKNIQALSPVDTIRVREATVDDSETLLSLYQKHHHHFIGSFDRTLAEQRYRLTQPDTNLRYLLAEDQTQDQTDRVVGYLLVEQSDKDVAQQEIAATTWPVISALLQEHERRLSACEHVPKEKTTIRWSVPEETFLFYHLASHIPFRCERQPHYSADWMARVGDLEPDVLYLTIDQRSFSLISDLQGIHQTDQTPDPQSSYHVKLTPQAFVQLCFGFRPIAWFASQAEQTIPEEIAPLLDALFPLSSSWVAGSDFF